MSRDVVGIEVGDYTARSDGERLRRGQVDLMHRGRFDGPDLADAIASVRPDAVLVDTIAYGAQTHAEATGIPRAILYPSVVPLPGKGIPPYGLGLRPRPDPVGRVRDALLWRVVERMFARTMLPGLNELRVAAGLRPYRSPLEITRDAEAVIAMTAEPLEYPRSDLPANVHFVGVQPWDPPARRVTEAGSGVTVKPKHLTPERLRAAVRSRDRAADAAARLAANSDPGRFADAALSLVSNGHRRTATV